MPDVPAEYVVGMVAGLLAALLIDFGLVMAAHARRARGPAPQARDAEIALYYGENRRQRSERRHWAHPGIFVMFAIMIFGDGRVGGADWVLAGLAALSAISLPQELGAMRRGLAVAPAIALHSHGLWLSGRRGTSFLPWRELDLIYTEPPETGGYRSEDEAVTLHVEAKDGRSWRYSSRHFPEGAPADFADLAGRANYLAAPAGSMLRG